MTKVPRAGIRVAFAAMLILTSALVIEGGARLFFVVKDGLRHRFLTVDPSLLDEYEIPDPQQPWNIRLRAGYSATVDQIILSKKEAGKVLSESYLQDRTGQLKVPR